MKTGDLDLQFPPLKVSENLNMEDVIKRLIRERDEARRVAVELAELGSFDELHSETREALTKAWGWAT